MTSQQKFIEQIGKAAQAYYSKYQIRPSLVIAMAIKESAWGVSALAAKNHNYFGMKWNTKCGTKWVEYKTKEFKDGKYVTVSAKFRSYDTLEEGIKGFYDFITGYKRYSNLIGEKDPATACKKIQADGWATAPDYATSLYTGYICKYDLTKYDQIEDIAAPDPVSDVKPYYIKGKVYTTKVGLYIRKAPDGIKKKPYELTVNAKVNSHTDPKGDAVLNAGTRVSCLDIKHEGSSTWILIPSGWICAVNYSGKIYVE